MVHIRIMDLTRHILYFLQVLHSFHCKIPQDVCLSFQCIDHVLSKDSQIMYLFHRVKVKIPLHLEVKLNKLLISVHNECFILKI